jgi:peptidoglycan/xylan/chitin deacetylase (PgdA/CDA1 family)
MPAGVEPDFVTFSVDGQCVSVTNTRPYGFRWDTTREAEGPHTLTIRTEGRAVLEYLLEVIVQNREPDPEPGYDPAAWQDLARRLVRPLKGSLAGYDAEQMLLHAYLRSAQHEEATRLCEAILARSWQRREVLPLLLQLYARAGRSRPVEEVSQPHSGVPGGQRVALTFDDGPNIPQTDQLLKLLDKYGARATFLVVGRRAEQYPYLLREIAAHGHEIGSHSYSHRRMQGLSEEEVLLEVLRTEWIVRQAGPQPVRFFRPPGGHSTPQVRAALARLGYTPIFWTINGGSYKYLPPAEAARRIMERTTDGTIFLLHNGPDNTLELLPELLRELQARGFRCVTVSEILQPPARAEPTDEL